MLIFENKGMPNITNEEVVRALWCYFQKHEWSLAQDLLHDDFIAQWPQSQIQFNGPSNYIGMNRAYPGEHDIKVLHIRSSGEAVMSEVEIKSIMPDGTRLHLFAISFFEFRGDKIIRAIEYWADTYEAPKWQLQFGHYSDM
jgi:hypothetical protein